MTPTIILKDGKLFMVLGAPGGAAIISAVLQVIVNVIDFHMNVQEAVNFPRIHYQWKPDLVQIERGVSPDTVAALKRMGYNIADSRSAATAEVETILASDGWLQGACDPRSNGKAVGY
jgi:gamma-glutamyltranspeptidase/glutathione hydrolase